MSTLKKPDNQWSAIDPRKPSDSRSRAGLLVESELDDNEIIGRYEIAEKLGQGASASVYLAWDPYIKRELSLKVSRPAHQAAGESIQEFKQRFFREAQSAGRLAHPAIVSIYDVGVDRDYCYIAMEYIDGDTLANYCTPGNLLPTAKMASVIYHLCSALDYAHQKGLVHLDIKPSNIMFNQAGEVKITDFGIAKFMVDRTLESGIAGTPSYMSPEQVKESSIDYLSDVFSLGCVVYEMITGTKAFPGDNHFAVLYKITHEEPIALTQANPDAPLVLEKIVHKALHKDPARRYQSCTDFAYELRVALRSLSDPNAVKVKKGEVVHYVHSVQFFHGFEKSQVAEILRASELLRVPAGDVLVSEGDVDDCFYIILSGRASVRRRHNKIATIKKGECFGEMAFLTGESRAATVVADTECALMKISAALLERSPANTQLLFLKRFSLTLLRRLSLSNIKVDDE